MKYSIMPQYEKLAKMQVSQVIKNKSAYLAASIAEYNLFKDYVKSPKNILELGCGLGRMSIYLHNQLKDDTIHYILADSTQNSKPRYGWNHDDKFYNDLKLTKQFAKDHNLNNFETFDLQTQNLEVLRDIDFVMSFLAVGFHAPIDSYLKTLLKITTQNCVMVFGVRKNTVDIKQYEKIFQDVRLFRNNAKIANRPTKEDILVLGVKK